jgi:cytochrome b561
LEKSKHSTAAKATGIGAGDGRTRYDGVAITLHWFTVALVLAQFLLSQTWGFFEKPTRHILIATHMSFGILLTAVILARIAWRLIPGHQVRPADVGWLEVASKVVHYLLYGLLAGEAVLGFVLRWSGNEPMSFFGILIPPPFAPFSREAHHLVGEAHELVGWTIIVLAAGHAAAALFHQYVLRDNLLDRMLPERSAS